MANGTVLAEILLSGDRQFRRSIESAGDSLDDTAGDATTMSGALSLAGETLDGVRGSALGAAFGLSRAAAEADDAGDEMLSLVPKAGSASAATTSFALSTEGASVGVTSLSSSLSAALIPAVGALSTMLAPIAAMVGTVGAALGGLAIGGGLVIGSGILAGFDRLKNTAENVFVLLRGQFESLGEQFVPMLVDALYALPRILRDTLNAIGGLDQFAGFFRDMIPVAERLVPQMAAALVDLGREALPVVRDFIGYLIENGPSIFREMVSTTRQLAPQVMEFTDALIDAAPALLDFGTFIFATVVPGLTDLVESLTPAMNLIGGLSDEAATVNSVFGNLPPAVRSLAAPLQVALIPALAGAKELMEEFGITWDEVLNGILRGAKVWVRTVTDALNGLITTMNGFIRQTNDLIPGFSMGTFEPLQMPEFAQYSTTQFSQARQQQRQKIDVNVAVTSDDEKFNAEVRDLSQSEINSTQTAQSDRLKRNLGVR